MGAPEMTPTGAISPDLVARPYEPLADSHAGTHGPARSVLCSRFREHRQAPGEAWLCALRYLTSTLAPASSIFFLMVSASALLMPSLMGLGAPSTRSLASFRPRLVTSRTALMVFTLFSPAAVRITVNSVFSSAAAAPAPPPAGAATATGAAAGGTPHLSPLSLMSFGNPRTRKPP